jgi:anti-sigma regulatory factor (Ser/Thr protein kinase)
LHVTGDVRSRTSSRSRYRETDDDMNGSPPDTDPTAALRAPAYIPHVPEQDSGVGRRFRPDRTSPRLAEITLGIGALPASVATARRHTRAVLSGWNMPYLAQPAELLVSEITTNAVQASQSMPETPPITLHLVAGIRSVLIQVWDASPAIPRLSATSSDDEHGRGLMLVHALSDEWGWYPSRNSGKVVWAVVTVPNL